MGLVQIKQAQIKFPLPGFWTVWRSGRVADCSPGGRIGSRPPPRVLLLTLSCSVELVRHLQTISLTWMWKKKKKICSTPVSFGPASPDAGVELLRQLFLQCTDKICVIIYFLQT